MTGGGGGFQDGVVRPYPVEDVDRGAREAEKVGIDFGLVGDGEAAFRQSAPAENPPVRPRAGERW